MKELWFPLFCCAVGLGIILDDCIAGKTGHKGRHCFANATCMDDLKCLQADGISPTCVKP